MRKFITSKFELDLSGYKMQTVDENHWFSDNFFTKYSFPFELNVTDELNVQLGNITDDNSQDIETYYEGIYVDGDKMEKAILEIEESPVSILLSATLRYGFEELPSFNKKLSELSLYQNMVDNIYTHAANVITKTWPEVNYNFPQIHTDQIDTDNETWFAFEKKLNNYVSGAFLENYIDTGDNLYYNKNIMQPLAYVLHIFARGFADDGYVLAGGDVYENPIFKKMLLFGDVDYYSSFPSESLELLIYKDSIYYIDDQRLIGYYRKSLFLDKNKRYKITGQIPTFERPTNFTRRTIIVYYNEIVLMNQLFYFEEVFTLDFFIDTDSSLIHELKFEVVSRLDLNETDIIADISAYVVFKKDEFGVPIPTINNLNEVNLKRAVPDITFGDFVKTFKNWYNIDFTIVDKNIFINFIESEINYKNAINLEDFQELEKKRKFNKGISFELSFNTEIDAKQFPYTYKKAFQSQNLISYGTYKTDDKTQKISIDGLPLPLANRSGINTAHAFEDNNSKVFTVLYSGLNSSDLNLTENPAPMLLDAVHAAHWRNWFDLRINGTNYTWNFKAYTEDMIGLKARGKIYAYGRYFVVKTINKTELSEDLFDVEIQCVSIR